MKINLIKSFISSNEHTKCLAYVTAIWTFKNTLRIMTNDYSLDIQSQYESSH